MSDGIKVVAWRYRDKEDADWRHLELPPLNAYDEVQPLILQSAHTEAMAAKDGEIERLRAELGAALKSQKCLHVFGADGAGSSCYLCGAQNRAYT